MNTKLEKYQKLGSFSHRNFIKIHDFFGVDFRIDFFIDFLMENGSQMEPKSTWGGELFSTLFATFSFMLILC